MKAIALLVSVGCLAASAAQAVELPTYTGNWEVACSSITPSPLENHAFGNPETTSMVVRWGVLKAGRATIELIGTETVDGRSLYHVAMEIRTSGLSDKIHSYRERTDSWIDAATLLTVAYYKETREGNYARDEQVVLDQGCGRFDRVEKRLDKGTTEHRQGVLPPATVDMLGYLYHLRAMPMKEGASFDLTLLSGDRLYPVTVEVVRRTKISGPGGWYDTYFLKPNLRGDPKDVKLRELQVWLTADDRQMPVRLKMDVQVGSILAELLPSKS